MPVGNFVSPEIIMGYKSPDFSALNPSQMMNNVLAYKQAKATQQANELALATAKQQAADKSLLLEAQNQPDSVNYLRGIGRLDLANQFAEAQRKESDAQLESKTKQLNYQNAVAAADKQKTDTALQTVRDMFTRVLQAHPDLNTPEALADYLKVSQTAHNDPNLGPILKAAGAYHADTVLKGQTALESGTLGNLIQSSALSAEDMRKNFAERQKAAEPTKAGALNPSDYTTASWALYNKTKDLNDLRKEPKVFAPSAPVDPGAVSFYADMIEAGNPLPMGAGTSIRSAVAAELSRRGVSAKDIVSAIGEVAGLKSGERTLGATSANQLAASEEAIPMIGIARDYVSKIDTGKFKSLNAISNWADTHTGDTNIVALNTALNSLVNSYARAISPKGVPTVSDKNHAREILDAALSKGQLNAALDVMGQEMQAARTGTTSAKQQIRVGVDGATPPPPADEKANVSDPLGIRKKK